MIKRKLHNIFMPSAQKLIDEVTREMEKPQKFRWQEFYDKFDVEIKKDMRRGDYKSWKSN